MNIPGGYNWLDVLLLAILVLGMGIGYVQGLLRQTLGLATLYVATILGAQYFSMIAGWIRAFFPNAPGRLVNGLGFFFILLLVTTLLNFLVSDAYQSTKVRLFPLIDHLGGSLLGLITFVIVISLSLPIIVFSTGENWPWGENARLAITTGLQGSRLLALFDLLTPNLLKAIVPWLPGGLPSIFNL